MRHRPDDIEKLLTITEVAEYLCVPVNTLYQWRYKGTGPNGIRVGRHVRYRRSDLEAWLESLAEARAVSPGRRSTTA